MRPPDLYVTLGVPRGATPGEVKRRFFQRAQTEHPDKGGDLAAWQHVSSAYSTLIDEDKRRAYDASIAADEMLSFLRGEDRVEEVRVPFLTALRGGHVLHHGRRVRIPARVAGATPTVEGGLVLRIRGHGDAGFPPGDLFLSVRVESHPHLKLDDRHALGLRMSLPVTLLELHQGGPLPVPTPWGTFYLRFGAGQLVPGEEVVLLGYGVRCSCPVVPRCSCEHGDLRVTVALQLPPADLALLHVLERLQGALAVRTSLEAALKED